MRAVIIAPTHWGHQRGHSQEGHAHCQGTANGIATCKSSALGGARREALVVVSKVAPCLGRVPYTSARRAPPGHFYSGRGAARALVTLPRDVAYDNAKSPRVNSHQCRKCSEARSRS